jgi:hypothetical protein
MTTQGTRFIATLPTIITGVHGASGMKLGNFINRMVRSLFLALALLAVTASPGRAEQAVDPANDGKFPWTPAHIKPQLWYDASDVSTITASEGRVSQWNDKSGYGMHLTASGNARPTTAGETINGRNVVIFDGVANVMVTASNPFSPAITDAGVFMVVNMKTPSNGILFGLSRDGANTSTRWQLQFHSPSKIFYYDAGGTGGTKRLIYMPNPAFPDDKILLAGLYDSVTDKAHQLWMGGAMVAGIGYGNTVNTAGNVSLGGTDAPGSFDHCAIAEFIAIKGTVSIATRRRIEGYLAHKWGLTADLPDDHLYKTVSPETESVTVLLAELASKEADRVRVAFESLVNAGPAIIPPLRKGFSGTTDPLVRLKIVDVFTHLRGDGREALPILSARVIQDKGAEREYAARAINWIVSDRNDGAEPLAIPERKEIEAALLADLGHEDPHVKGSAARTAAYLVPFLSAAAREALVPILASINERDAAIALAERLDLTRPGMEAMRTAIAAKDHKAVLDLFRARLVKRLRSMDFSGVPAERSYNRTLTADAQLLVGRWTLDDYKKAYKRDWIDTFSGIKEEDYPLLKASGLMAPPGTPIQWLGPDGDSQRVGQYIGAWGGGGWTFNTSLIDAWWFSGEAIYKEKWLEICEGYFHEYFTAATRKKLSPDCKPLASFFHLHTAWRMKNSFLPALALLAKHLDHEMAPAPLPGWLKFWPSEAVQKARVEANKTVTSEVSPESLAKLPAAPLARIAISLTEETAPFLIESYITGDYFFANQTFDGILAVATIALVFDDLKKSRELEKVVDRAIPWWAGRVMYRDGGALEQCFSYSLGYAAQLDFQATLFASQGCTGAWIEEFRLLSKSAYNFWDQIQTPQGLLPCVGNSKYGARAPREAHPQVSTYFPFSGYAGLRTPGAPEDQLFMMFANSRRSVGHMSPNTGSVHITAYGRDLIAPGGSPSYSLGQLKDKAEEVAFDKYAGEHSTFKNSTIIVNGLPQSTYNRGRFMDLLASASAIPVRARWVSNADFDFAESRWTGYDRRVSLPHSPVEEYVNDIQHHRQVVFVKTAGVWLVVDMMRHDPEIKGKALDILHTRLPAKLSPSPYTFTQIWNLAPPRDETRHYFGFSNEQVQIDEAKQRVYTNDPAGVNLELLHFGAKPLQYRKFFGHKDDQQYLGWLVDGKGVLGTPRVDLHANWEQTREEFVGGKVLPIATVIAPSRDAKSIIATAKTRVEQDGLVSGCELTLHDGKTVTFLASGAPALLKAGDLVAHAELLVLVGRPGERIQRGIILGCTGLHVGNRWDAWRPVETPDFEFTYDGKQVSVLQKVAIPTGKPAVLTSEVADK